MTDHIRVCRICGTNLEADDIWDCKLHVRSWTSERVAPRHWRLQPEVRDQHDQHGNNYDLLSPEDKQALEDGTWFRAHQDTLCPTCQLEYWRHPNVMGALWLRRLCTGDLVKL